MNYSDVVRALFLCTLFFIYTVGEGRNLRLSEKEDLEIEQQLKLLNKPAVKTINMDDGTIYDCVDFYKQPAFDHPSLKNHTFDINKIRRGHVSSKYRKNFKLEDGDCLIGTVPIRRITRDDLIRERHYTSFRSLFAGQNPDADYAVARMKVGPQRYKGASGFVSIYAPNVTKSQYSAARYLLRNGPDSIEVGWRVDPALYGDFNSHLFIRTTINNSSFISLRQPGFVVTTERILDGSLNNTSKLGGPIYRFISAITQDQSGNWVLNSGANNFQIGFWPKNIFSSDGLQQLASYVEWGGEVFSPPGTPKPGMGTGDKYLIQDNDYDCFYNKITVTNENGGSVDADDLELYVNNSRYQIFDAGNKGGDIGRIIYFGGPPSDD